MRFKRGLFLLFIVIIIAIGYQKYKQLFGPTPFPILDTTTYWGPGSKDNYFEDTSIHPFKISLSEASVKELRNDINGPFRLAAPLEGTNMEYGMNSNKLKEFLHYWRDIYLPNWSERQTYLNSLPHYKTQIQGLNIHFIHAKPSRDTTAVVVPLLLLHGWPGSVREFYDFIPKLVGNRTNAEIVFEVIAPSLPGFGWSDAPTKKGFGAAEMSIVLRNLMVRLGFDYFMIQGGDWGSVVGSHMATFFPDNVIGYHSNFCVLQTPLSHVKGFLASLYPSYFIDEKYQHFVFPIMDKYKFLVQETGYFHIQATKPDTIGVALTDNPIGLAAYILEKFRMLYNRVPMDSLLDNVMIYHMTNSMGTAVRLYAESYSVKQLALNLGRVPSHVATGCVRFLEDIGHALDWQLQDKYLYLIHSTWYNTSSHFAAFESADLLYSDFIKFMYKYEKFTRENLNKPKDEDKK